MASSSSLNWDLPLSFSYSSLCVCAYMWCVCVCVWVCVGGCVCGVSNEVMSPRKACDVSVLQHCQLRPYIWSLSFKSLNKLFQLLCQA